MGESEGDFLKEIKEKNEKEEERVLEEDSYLKYVKTIINRDFFPLNFDKSEEKVPEHLKLNSFTNNFTSDQIERLKFLINDNQQNILQSQSDSILQKPSNLTTTTINKFNLIIKDTNDNNKYLSKKRNNNCELLCYENTRLPLNFIENLVQTDEKLLRQTLIKKFDNNRKLSEEYDIFINSTNQNITEKQKESESNDFLLPTTNKIRINQYFHIQKESSREKIAHHLMSNSNVRSNSQKNTNSSSSNNNNNNHNHNNNHSSTKNKLLKSIQINESLNTHNYNQTNKNKKNGNYVFLKSISRLNSIRENKLKKNGKI